MFPAAENRSSDGVDVAGIQRDFASFATQEIVCSDCSTPQTPLSIYLSIYEISNHLISEHPTESTLISHWKKVQSAPLKEHKEKGQERSKREDQSEVRPSNTGRDLDFTDQTLLQISKRELNQIMDKRDKKISMLEEEQRVLIQEIEQLKHETAEEEKEKAFIEDALTNSTKIRKEAALKIQELEEALRAETQKQQEAETRLIRETEETSKVQLALAQVEYNLELSRRQWEEDRSHLLGEHRQETSHLKAAAIQAQEDLDQERLK
ncbi:plasminogen-binding group A streptococcal M-like protein PAM [Trachinotus anak]|uniref:plasminogen-binding group A streptococcal M-like protein PAM n=1 Tax=Trachinotus anak TaxID=443729 RepID=UPI0039F181B2